MTKHLVIPDTQVKPGVPTEHLSWAGRFAAEKHPDKIIFIGDHWDLPSLSSYDVGKKSFEGRRYTDDVEAGNAAMQLFMNTVIEEQIRCERNHRNRWNPLFYFFLGNHEDRIRRVIESDRKLEDLIGLKDLDFSQFEVIPYLEVRNLDGVHYSHYFTSGVLGRPVTSARQLLNKKHASCVMGHVQKRDIAYDYTADGKQITGIFCGTFYQHEEEYLNPQGNKHWRGVWMLHDIKDGSFDEMPVSLSYLRGRYG